MQQGSCRQCEAVHSAQRRQAEYDRSVALVFPWPGVWEWGDIVSITMKLLRKEQSLVLWCFSASLLLSSDGHDFSDSKYSQTSNLPRVKGHGVW
jgi:hypothetical protein